MTLYQQGVCVLALCAAVSTLQAEVLVILPETGPMARAGLSIQQGLKSANQRTGGQTHYVFVDSNGKNIARLLKQHVNKNTQLIIGPLAPQEVNALIATAPKLPVLALNEVEQQQKNVWQYSLSKDADVQALIKVLKQDKISTLYVYRDTSNMKDSQSFLLSLIERFEGQVQMVDEVPKKLDKKSGLLLLGKNSWLNAIESLPNKKIYAQAIAIEDSQPLPIGLKFCDVPAIYQQRWPDVMDAYQQLPSSMPYQRLMAFGGDVWSMSQAMLTEPNMKDYRFSGRTGEIHMLNGQIQRVPACFSYGKKGIKAI